MAATVRLRLPAPTRGARWRRAVGPALAPLGALAALWPVLVASPVLGGPCLALAVGTAGWVAARAMAPLDHANDNAVQATVAIRGDDGRSRRTDALRPILADLTGAGARRKEGRGDRPHRTAAAESHDAISTPLRPDDADRLDA